MRPYEAVIVFNPELSEDKIDASLSKFEKKIKEAGATDIVVDKWGSKRLQFRMKRGKKCTDGVYTLFKFNSEGKAPNILTNSLKVSEEVIRFQVIASSQDKHEPKDEKVEIEPSVLVAHGESAQ